MSIQTDILKRFGLNKNKVKKVRVKDIRYYGSNKDLPKRLTLDISKYSDIPVGFGNLNCKVYRAIKEKTGREAISCRLD